MTRPDTKAPSVFILSDAAIDEYLATLYVHSLGERYHIAGESIVNADCIAGPAMETGWKIRNYLDIDIPLGLSQARGWNPFPWEYREDCIAFGNCPALRDQPTHPEQPPYTDGDAMLERFLDNNSDNDKIILCLCPITPLTDLLKRRPELAANIDHLIWMAGALDVPGNLDPETVPAALCNDKAEWNVFWDPFGADWLFKNTTFPITLAPLDVSDAVRITPQLLKCLQEQAGQGSRLSNLALQGYELVQAQPYYRLWDVTAAAALDDMALFERQRRRLAVICDEKEQGAMIEDSNGREVDCLMEIRDLEGFYKRVCERFSQR